MVASSDAAWANSNDEEGRDHKSQAGYIVLFTKLQHAARKRSSIFNAEFETLSTLSAETQAIVESAAVACWFRYLIAKMF